MAQAKPTLNPLTDTPKNKTDITKGFMLAYMKSSKPTREDIDWFKEIVRNPEYIKTYYNRFTQENYQDIDIPKVREKFCERFYPNLIQKKKKNRTFIETIESL